MAIWRRSQARSERLRQDGAVARKRKQQSHQQRCLLLKAKR
jgi:hypothetical protein